ncbi:hypothetical protein VJ918_08425 [Adlercreutzia sp. R21]|nr:hypothetical protein [Adlercreutzia sp. R21]MEC4184833.1 hypothetical protein [Adlercreutzia sp. R21]
MKRIWADGNIWLLTAAAVAAALWMAFDWTGMAAGQKALFR